MFSIRRAAATEAPTIARFLRDLLVEMVPLGGPPVAAEPDLWSRLEREIREGLEGKGHLHLLAQVVDPVPTPVGWAQARVVGRPPVYEGARVLHIHAVYVSPPYRNRGIGRALLEAVLEWGRSIGCTEAELNVLIDNPARSLYRDLGFSAFEIEMTRKL